MVKIVVSVDKEKCIACGACVAIAPEIFEFESDGKSQTKITKISDGDLIQKVKEAKDACPTGAIITEEE
ncbi:MAG TPA: ferredoxin [Candidatus Nanopusillus sp.]|nr:ferredoxin [Candidatus Nanopusillus sp.]HIP90613.1 ferredoxin [Candidatus Nanopusillus sp.]